MKSRTACVSPSGLTVDDLLYVVRDFADMLRLDDAGEETRALLTSEAASLWPFAMPGPDGGNEPAGMDYRKRRAARGCL